MRFGLYAPIPMVAVGSPEVSKAVAEALLPLPDGARDAQYDLTLDVLSAADRSGYDLALFAERHLGNDLAAWVLAGAVAPRLQNITALVAVHPGLWSPAMVAKLTASLDRIAPGRVALNIVNGWFDKEFEMFGGTVLKGIDRYTRSTEFIEILRELWRLETVTTDTQYYQLDDAQLLLRPASADLPEIYSVSRSDEGKEFIANACDWWFIEFPKEATSVDEVLRSVEASIAEMRQRAERAGRRIRFALNPLAAIGPSREEALDQTIKQIFEYENSGDTRKIETRLIPQTRGGCVGTAADVRRQVERYESMGVELLLLKMVSSVPNVELIGREIVQPTSTQQSVSV